ncbi:hypothetical protein CPB84DRAFT_1964902 [Gymnopilus junonius]|uniref:Uncharacterized protein n=1 Tax=Gymnopilus junonius TaxID=109634 RepID=A0A9P5TK81_GYMJU|nr:hypothetical protein CPB84DRAFT_1964902 [Gymnopilus junonius]
MSAKIPRPQSNNDDPASNPLCHQITSALAAITVLKQFAHPGVVIAWTKFAHSESTTNILNFLASVYPTQDSWPDYICIDKACQVLATAVINGSWEDYLCWTYCNPAPANNVAPNLLGGYQSIAKWMTPENFNWFIHVMLFYHTKYTIKKQQKKQSNQETEDGDIGCDEETETEEEEGSDEE